jgi:hypothetical protein
LNNGPLDVGHLSPFYNLNLSLSIQNVRSLNVSTKNDITTQKIIAICGLKTDIIFLCDLRLNSEKNIHAVHDLEKQFFFLMDINSFIIHPNPIEVLVF